MTTMLRTLTTNLSPEQQQRLHPEFIANEQSYLRLRPSLLTQYFGQWVAVDNDKVIAAGLNLFDVMDQALKVAPHPYVAIVGEEDKVVFRVRRAVFPYDRTYRPFPLPRLTATFWNHAETYSHQFSDVIPDTGAHVSVLSNSACQAIDLFNSPSIAGAAGGVVGASVTAVFYRGKVEIDGNRYEALIQPVPGQQERIVGRDVLNQQRVLFDGPANEVIVNP